MTKRHFAGVRGSCSETGMDTFGERVYVLASDFEAAIRRIQHTVDCHVPVGEVRDILLEMCGQELGSTVDAFSESPK